MNHFQHTRVIDADPAAVYAAITTAEGLRAWWTPTCDADAHVGGAAHFRFGETFCAMSIEQLDPNRGVRWFCTHVEAAGTSTQITEWIGTEIVFRLTPTIDGRTRLDFEHIGLVPTLGCYDLCSTCWSYFLGSLQQFVETGRGTPWVVEQQCAA